MTVVQRAYYAAGAWVRRENPPRAIMPVSVLVAGATESAVPDLARAWARRLRWGQFNETVFAMDSLPQGSSPAGRTIGALIVELSETQQEPEYADGNPSPDVSLVRLVLNQPVSSDHADSNLMVERREDIREIVNTTSGEVS